jgi:hypothetical protein
LNRPRVVQCAAGIEHLLDQRPLRIFNVDDGQALRPVRDIGVRARGIQPARISQSNCCVGKRNGPNRFGKIDNLQPVIVSDESISELNCNAARIAKKPVR